MSCYLFWVGCLFITGNPGFLDSLLVQWDWFHLTQEHHTAKMNLTPWLTSFNLSVYSPESYQFSHHIAIPFFRIITLFTIINKHNQSGENDNALFYFSPICLSWESLMWQKWPTLWRWMCLCWWHALKTPWLTPRYSKNYWSSSFSPQVFQNCSSN